MLPTWTIQLHLWSREHLQCIMKGLAVDFSIGLLLVLLLDLVLAQQDSLISAIGSRRTVRRQQGTTNRLPLYMMQLYRTMLTEDRRVRGPDAVPIRTEENPGLHQADSVVSLVAKSEYSTLENKLGHFFVFCFQLYPHCNTMQSIHHS